MREREREREREGERGPRASRGGAERERDRIQSRLQAPGSGLRAVSTEFHAELKSDA